MKYVDVCLFIRKTDCYILGIHTVRKTIVKET